MFLMDESVLDNCLVKQKDSIIAIINRGDTILAQELLDHSRELWYVLGYGYKVREIEQRIAQMNLRSSLTMIESDI